MRISLICLLLICELSIAQTKLPAIIPASPEVSSLLTDVTFSSSLNTGAAQTNFNLHSLKVGSFQLPINVDYSTNGVRVDDIPSRVGLGWTLNAGGYVSRVVHDEPDGSAPFLTPPTNLASKNETLYNFLNYASTAGYDTEWDEYSYSFNGYSGKFYVDNNGNGITVPLNNLKIKMNGYNQSSKDIEITTPDGVKYIFGFTTKENTRQITAQNDGNNAFVTKDNFTETAWFLDKIITVDNEVISLFYTPIICNYTTGNFQQMIKPFFSSTVCNGVSCPSSVTTGTNFTKYDTYCLNKIASSSEVVDFYYENRPDNSGDVRLKTFSVRETQNIFSKKVFRFDYYTPTVNNSSTNKRYFLTAIRQKEIGTGSVDNIDSGNFLTYSYSYFDIDNMPDRLTYGQDWFGFNNGATSNAYLVPFVASIANYVVNGYNGGNRNPSTIEDIRKGALKNIQYPTGGFKEFEYEQHTLLNNLSTPVYSTISVNGGGSGEYSPLTYYSSTVYLSADQNVQVNTQSLKGPIYTNSTTGEGNKIYELKLVNTGTGQTVLYRKYYFYQSETIPLSLAGGNSYRLELTVWGDLNAGNASMNYDYSTINSYENKPVCGMRVKKMLTYDPVAKKRTNLFYTYAGFSDLSKSSAVGPQSTLNYNLERYGIACNEGTIGAHIQICNSYSVSSSSLYPVNLFSGSPYAYTNVIESDDSTFANGFTEHMFHTYIPSPPVISWLGSSTSVNATNMATVLNGLEYKTRIYKKGTSGYVLLKEVENQFDFDNYNAYRQNYFISKRWNYVGYTVPIHDEMFDGFDLIEYRFGSNWIKKITTTTIDFDENGLNPLTKKDYYTYGDISHQQITKQESTTSMMLDTTKTEFYYPIDFALKSSPYNIYDTLMSEYKIVTPILQKVLKSGSLQSELKTSYSDFNGYLGVSQVEEKLLNYSFEKKLIFSSYDATGHVEEVKKAQDNPISYLWTLNGAHVLAEFQNAIKSDVAYTSFEDGENGSWQIASSARSGSAFFTGKLAYVLSNGTIQHTAGTTKTYRLSYWTQSASPITATGTISTKNGAVLPNGWRYFEHTITGVSIIQLTGSAIIDELRLCPSDALVKSFTYNEMGLVSSVSDEFNQYRLFSYDGYGRLKQVTDENKNILSAYQYVYKEPSVNCTSFTANWQATGQTRCQKNSSNNNTGYVEQQMQDINPCSSSYLQTTWTVMAFSTSTCPVVANCTGVDKRIVNGICETGLMVFTGGGFNNGTNYCVYHYEWSDGYWSPNYTSYGSFCAID